MVAQSDRKEIRKARAIRFSDSEWRALGRMGTREGEPQITRFIRHTMVGLAQGELEIVDAKGASGGGLAEDMAKKVAEMLPGRASNLESSVAYRSLISAAVETNILLRKLVLADRKNGEKMAVDAREELKKVLRQLELE